jgi:opacity protein-like surface antigen
MLRFFLVTIVSIVSQLGCVHVLKSQYTGQSPSISAYLAPTASRVNSQDKFINENGFNLGWQLGLNREKTFGFNENYAYTLGLAFSMNQGGVLNFREGGNYLPNAELRPSLRTGDHPLPPGVDIRYKLNYLIFPASLKLYTQAVKNWRYFAELPILTLGFRVKSTADLSAASLSEQDIRINKDMRWLFAQIGLGLGAQKEIFSGNAIYWGLFFHQSILDLKRNNGWKFIEDKRVPNDSKMILGQLSVRLGFVF